MNLTRRALLQQASLALASAGLSQMGLSHLTRRYQQVLATPTSRKLALLIGINKYADEVCGFSNTKGTILQGARTDVELHRELLISRFGFHPSNIVTLLDQQATRDGIETALQFHLLDQVKAHDIVVFHFSGLGSTVQFLSSSESDQVLDDATSTHQTLVPIDGILPSPENPQLYDFMQATLASFLRALPTENIVSLLDIGYRSPASLLGNLRVRSRLKTLQDVVLDDDSALRRRLASRTSEELLSQSSAKDSEFPGVLLMGANNQGIATEAHWNGFSAGVLTYALTQKLWNMTPATSIQTSLGDVSSVIEQFVGPHHQPMVSGLSSTKLPQTLPAYLNLSSTVLGADGSVLAHDEEKSTLDLWLAGLTPNVLEYCSDSSYLECFIPSEVVSSESDGPAVEDPLREETFVILQGRSNNGLNVTARLVPSVHSTIFTDAIPAGCLIQEKIRAIPKDVNLVVALDHNLDRIERVDATSALSAISKVTSSVAGEQRADCLFGKISSSDIPSSAKEPLSGTGADSIQDADSEDKGSTIRHMYGIFKPGRSLIENTLVQSEEAVKTSIHRVTPQLKGVLATKFLQLTENQAGSRLGLEVSLEKIATQSQQISQPQPLMVQSTYRSGLTPTRPLVPKWAGNSAIPTAQVGDHIQYRFNNYGDRPLYCLFINVDSKGNITALYPSGTPHSKATSGQSTSISQEDEQFIPVNAVATVPRPNSTVPWTINSSPGLVTTYVIVSCDAFTETVNRLPQLKQPVGNIRAMVSLPDPLTVSHSILKDLNDASQSMIEQLALDVSNDRYNLDMGCWATFNFTYEVISRTSLSVPT